MTDNLRHHIDEAMTLAAAHLGQGRVADYIPALAKVDPAKLGFALALPVGVQGLHAGARAAPRR
jgi:glutaminase